VPDNSFATKLLRWNPQAKFMHGLLRMINWCVSFADAFAEFAQVLIARHSRLVHADLSAVAANSFTACSLGRISE
jgi:hypothetical protein